MECNRMCIILIGGFMTVNGVGMVKQELSSLIIEEEKYEREEFIRIEIKQFN
jgi:hypothetical protein